MARKKKTNKASDEKLQNLVEAAEDLNEVLGLDDDPIPTDLDLSELEEEIKDIFDEIDWKEDRKVLKESTIAALKDLGFKVPKDDDDDDDKDDGKDDDDKDGKDDDGDDDDKDGKDDDDDKPLSLVEQVSVGKIADLKTLVEENDEFKKLRKGLKKYKGLEGFKELKAAMQEIVGKPESKVSRPKKEKKEREPSIRDAMFTIMAKNVDMETKKLSAALEKKGFDVDEKKGTFNTTLNTIRKFVAAMKDAGTLE